MKAIFLAAVALALSVSQASAVSLAVKLACKNDYYAHCSMHAVGSPGVRQCMRAVGPRLSKGCIGALADAGMIKSTKSTRVASKKAAHQKVAQKATAKKRLAKNKKSAPAYASKKVSNKKVALRKAAPQKVVAESRPSKKRYAEKRVKYASWD